jgi:hypothetical protein
MATVARNAEGSGKTTVSGHYRVQEEVYSSLESEAREHKVSLNALVSHVLSDHTRDDSLAEEVETIRVTKDAFRLFLDAISEDRLREIGRLSVNRGADAMMMAVSGAINLDAVLDELNIFSRWSCYSIHHTNANGKRIITLMHVLGPKFSVLLVGYVTALFGQISISPKVKTTNSSVTIEY